MTRLASPGATAMTGAAALPRRNGELVFDAPWQGRVFGMALALVERLGLAWTEFQQRLIREIAAHPDTPYYQCWLAALERPQPYAGWILIEEKAEGGDMLAKLAREAFPLGGAGVRAQ